MIRVITTFLMLLFVTKVFSLDTNAVWIKRSDIAYTINFAPGHSDSCENLYYYGVGTVGTHKSFEKGVDFAVTLDGSIFYSNHDALKLIGVDRPTRHIIAQQKKLLSDYNLEKGIDFDLRNGFFGETPQNAEGQVAIYNKGIIENGYLITDHDKNGRIDYDFTDWDIYYPVTENNGAYRADITYANIEEYSDFLDDYIPIGGGGVSISFSTNKGPFMSVGFDPETESIFTGEQYYKKPFTQIMVKTYVVKKDNYRGLVAGSSLMSAPLPSDMPGDVRIKPEYYDDAVNDGVYKNKNGTYYIKPKFIGSEEQNLVELFSNTIPRMKAKYPQSSWNEKYHFNEVCFKGGKPYMPTKAVFKDEYKKVRADFGFPEYNAEPAGLTIRKGM